MPSYFLPEEVRTGTVDENGHITFEKDDESVLTYTLRWKQLLGGDRIFTSDWSRESGSVTDNGSAMTSDTTAITVSHADGVFKNTITTERGHTHVRRVRFVRRDT